MFFTGITLFKATTSMTLANNLAAKSCTNFAALLEESLQAKGDEFIPLDRKDEQLVKNYNIFLEKHGIDGNCRKQEALRIFVLLKNNGFIKETSNTIKVNFPVVLPTSNRPTFLQGAENFFSRLTCLDTRTFADKEKTLTAIEETYIEHELQKTFFNIGVEEWLEGIWEGSRKVANNEYKEKLAITKPGKCIWTETHWKNKPPFEYNAEFYKEGNKYIAIRANNADVLEFLGAGDTYNNVPTIIEEILEKKPRNSTFTLSKTINENQIEARWAGIGWNLHNDIKDPLYKHLKTIHNTSEPYTFYRTNSSVKKINKQRPSWYDNDKIWLLASSSSVAILITIYKFSYSKCLPQKTTKIKSAKTNSVNGLSSLTPSFFEHSSGTTPHKAVANTTITGSASSSSTVTDIPLPETQNEYALLFEQQYLHESNPTAQKFSTFLSKFKDFQDPHNPPKVFISYAWPTPKISSELWTREFINTFALDLGTAGLDVQIDIENSRFGHNAEQFMRENILSPDRRVILIGTKTLMEKHQHTQGTANVCNELQLIQQKRKDPKCVCKHSVIPILLSGSLSSSLPAYFSTYTVIEDFTENEAGKRHSYMFHMKEVLSSIYFDRLNEPRIEKMYKDFGNNDPKLELLKNEGLPPETIELAKQKNINYSQTEQAKLNAIARNIIEERFPKQPAPSN